MITFWFFLLCIQHIPTRNIFHDISKGSLYGGRLKTKAFVLKFRIHFNHIHHLLMYPSVHTFWLHFEHTEEKSWKLLTYIFNEFILESPRLLRSHQVAMFKVIQSIILDKAGKYDKFQLPFLRNYNDVIYFIGTRFNHNVIRGGIGLCHQCQVQGWGATCRTCEYLIPRSPFMPESTSFLHGQAQ